MRGLSQSLKIALEWTRHTLSRRPVLRPLVLVLQLLVWLLSTIWRVFLHFFPLITAATCFLFVWTMIARFYNTKIPSSGIPFPLPRAYFVITLGAIPIWGLAMIAYVVFQAAVSRAWTFLLGKGRGYRPIAVDPLGLTDEKGVEGRRSREAHKNCAVALVIYLSAVLLGLYMLHTYELPVDHQFKKRVELANRVPKPGGYGSGDKLFIAALFYNNADVLPYWTTEITKLINYLGSDNVFVSIVESHSGDRTAALLEDFDRNLAAMNVPRRVLTHEPTPRPPMSTKEQRIVFLAALRNVAMEPLVEKGGFKRVLWSNDVYVEAEAIVELLNTNHGDYDMACGLDQGPWGLYDMWVLRDRLGRIGSTVWPYLLETTGIRAIMRDEPARVSACWNGIAVMRADPFLPPALRSGTQLSTTPLARPLAPTHPSFPRHANQTPATAPPLRFRDSAPGECFSSECFLLPYDLRRVFGMENIYVNPRVITAYSWSYYVWFKYVTRHWAVKWWIRNVENGHGIHLGQLILGPPEKLYIWDGGECHPYWD
ncbi:cryptococcal mannosyltransferase 1-domain-containing protein [Mycena pura]|uniref:Cryptococcal mannosyltransferase 1-domain-containing protein n=1 Tax=Mycena pura TaxID=153505 RepID=A0AAD6YG26_9AGAR|nr:cryptococcal mannosyltransferase 1-domain-containing protein [Mycena pura]